MESVGSCIHRARPICCDSKTRRPGLCWTGCDCCSHLHLYAFTSGMFGSSTVSWVDPWRSTPPPCSCTASSFTGYRTSTPPEVQLILFTTTHSCSAQWKYSRCSHNSIKESTRPHQTWSSKQDGDLSVLYISLSFFPPQYAHVETERSTYINITPPEKNLIMGSQLTPWEFTPMFASKLLFSLISLKQQGSPSDCGAEISLSQQQLITTWLRVNQSPLEGTSSMHLYFCFFSLSSLHPGLPGDASGVFIWNLVSGVHMCYSHSNIIVYFKECRRTSKLFYA